LQPIFGSNIKEDKSNKVRANIY